MSDDDEQRKRTAAAEVARAVDEALANDPVAAEARVSGAPGFVPPTPTPEDVARLRECLQQDLRRWRQTLD